MGKVTDQIEDRHVRFIEKQHMFFVATSPRANDGHINVSPKGKDTFRVLGPKRVAYLDYVGSGVETIAHVRENGRITIMFCGFEGSPNILRIYGVGSVVRPGDSEWARLMELFEPHPSIRAILTIDVGRVADSCGYAVPLMAYEGERDHQDAWAERKGPEGIENYKAEKNAVSIDGLPGLS